VKVRGILVLVAVLCLPVAACTTIDRESVSPAQGDFLDEVANLGGFDADKLETGTLLCALWADLIANDRGLAPMSGIERSVVEGKGASGPNTEAYANAANQYLCAGRRQSARKVFNAKDQRYYDDPDIEPPPDSGDGYQFGD
jgi:hypothetical protein